MEQVCVWHLRMGTEIHSSSCSVLLWKTFFFIDIFLQVPDYYDIIKKPIALSIIREKVNNCEYQSASKLSVYLLCLYKFTIILIRYTDLPSQVQKTSPHSHISFLHLHVFTAEYVDDVELMFSNCLEYNPRNTTEAKAGIRLQAFFHSELQRLGVAARTSPPQKRSRM